MTDFAVRGGLLDPSGQKFSFRSNDAREGFHLRGRRAQGEAALAAPRFDTLKLHKRTAVAAPALPAPPEISSELNDPAELSEESMADELIRGYVDFLKSLQREGVADPESVLEQSASLTRTVLSPLGLTEDDIAQLSITSEYSMAEVYAAYAAVDASGAEAGMFYSSVADGQLRADIITKDGREFHVEVQVHAEVTVQAQLSSNIEGQADPLALDLDGDGEISLSDPTNGILFDINGDGVREQSAFVRGADGFLALDRNGNDRIDDGKELFGDQNGAAHGFEELAKYDEDANGSIDAKDSIFEKLRIVTAGEGGRLDQHTLADYGVDSFRLAYSSVQMAAEGGNSIAQTGSYYRSSFAYNLADITLGYRALSKEA